MAGIEAAAGVAFVADGDAGGGGAFAVFAGGGALAGADVDVVAVEGEVFLAGEAGADDVDAATVAFAGGQVGVAADVKGGANVVDVGVVALFFGGDFFGAAADVEATGGGGGRGTGPAGRDL